MSFVALSSAKFCRASLFVSVPFNASFAACSLTFAASTSACVTFSLANVAFASSTALLYADCLSASAL